jgi:hypothetical protein
MEGQDSPRTDADRRAFLQTAGKIAVVVPPAMTVLLSTGMSSPAIAASGSTSGSGEGRPGNDSDGDDDND